MNENAQPKEKTDTASALKKLQYQMDLIEKKLDLLLQQTKPREFKGKSFSKPRSKYDDSKRHSKPKYARGKEEVSSEGKFYHGRPFTKAKDSGKPSFSAKKRSTKKQK